MDSQPIIAKFDTGLIQKKAATFDAAFFYGINSCMSSKSKIKGSSWERDVANYLSDTYDASFTRVPNSGAFVGGKNAHRKDSLDANQIKSFKGDIIPPDNWNHLNTECKSYADFPFHLLFTNECKQLETWISQCLEVEDADDVSIIFMKITRKGKYVAVSGKFDWKKTCYLKYNSISYGEWYLIEFDEFFKHNKDNLKLFAA